MIINLKSPFYKEENQNVFLLTPYTNYPNILIWKRTESQLNEHFYLKNRFYLINQILENKNLSQNLKDSEYVNNIVYWNPQEDLKILSKFEFQLIHPWTWKSLKFLLLHFLNTFQEELNKDIFLSEYLEDKNFINKLNIYFENQLNLENQFKKVEEFVETLNSLKELLNYKTEFENIDNNIKKVLMELDLINKIPSNNNKQGLIDSFIKKVQLNKQGWLNIKNRLVQINSELESKTEKFIILFKIFLDFKENFNREQMISNQIEERNTIMTDLNNWDTRLDFLNLFNNTSFEIGNPIKNIQDVASDSLDLISDVASSVWDVAWNIVEWIWDVVGSITD